MLGLSLHKCLLQIVARLLQLHSQRVMQKVTEPNYGLVQFSSVTSLAVSTAKYIE